MSSVRLVAILILVSALPMASRAAAQGSQGGVLAGVVVSRPAGRLVPGAVITVDGTQLSTTPNGAGRFRLDGIPAGSVVLVVKAPGFLDLRTAAVQVRAGEITLLHIELDATPNFMERVQVTATKGPLRVGDVAAQTDIVDRATIESRGDQSLVQAIAHVPGAIVSTQLGIFESVMLRGMPRGDPEFTNTLLLVDGVPQTTSRNGSRVIGLTINDASSIEIVRGPNSALYGRTAIGGSVNVRTADPTATPELDLDFTGGQFGTAKGVVRASGPIEQWGGYYLSVGKERNGGYFNTKTGGDYVNGNTAFFGKLTFSPDSKSVGSVSVNRVNSDNSTPTNEPIIAGQLLHIIDPRFDRLTNFNVPGPNYHQGESRLTFNYTRQLSPWARLVEVFGYRDVQQQFINDGDFIGSPFDLMAHTVEQYPFNQDLREKIAYQELRLEVMPNIGQVKNSLIIGGSYERTSGTLATEFLFTDEENEGIPINYLNPVIPPMATWSHDVQPTRTYHLGNTGLFAQYMIEPTARWVFSAGGRYDRLALDNLREGGTRLQQTFSAFSPKAGATFKVLGVAANSPATLNVYGAYSHAFLPPRAPSSLTPANVTLVLHPEDIDNVEGGLKGSLARGRVSLEATYFHMMEDGVVLNQRQGPFFFPTNAGKVKYQGVETGITLAPSPNASVFANASFYRNRFADFVIQSEDGDEILTGNRLPISPSYVINWGATVRPAPMIEATLNVKHVSTVQADNDNTFAVPSYSIVDAAASWRRGPLRVTLSAHNLFNKEYYWNADGETADPGRPRQLLLVLAVRVK
ncbi:MAG: TonB-dependent receptor [Vicinamibacterales bacterium]